MLHLHRSERADALVAQLGSLLGSAAPDPFAGELVAVATRGMERWLDQRLSHVLGSRPGVGDGICANVRFPSPAQLIADSVATVTGLDPEQDPWVPERLVWPLLELIDDALGEPWIAPLAAYLGADRDPPDPVRAGRRLTILRRLAGHLYRYALHRPDMVAAWRDGRDEDGTGIMLPGAARWQAEVWRRLIRRVAVLDPATRIAAACRVIAAEPERLELPTRVAAFGLTRLPAGSLAVLRSLSVGREVHLFLLHPSPGLWNAVAQRPLRQSPERPRRGRLLRSEDATARLARHPLLASWGRDAREMQVVLGEDTIAAGDDHHPPPAASPASTPTTLLERIQSDIRLNQAPPGVPAAGQPDGRPALDDADHSIQVHACHGRARQVEVVREAILHALADDPTLEPRDVIVMCPDVETFAPLIQATFGTPEVVAEEAEDDRSGSAATPPWDPAPQPAPVDLRVRLADRSLRQTNPLLGLVAALLELADRRVTASEVLDLAGRGPVRRLFGLDDDDLQRLAGWVAQSGIRWGLDAVHRRPWRLETLEHGTWRAGLDRLLLGVTMTEDGDRLFAGVLPLDDVDSRGIELAGRLAELLERLARALGGFRPQSLVEWARALEDAVDALGSTSDRDRWQRAELARLLDDLREEAQGREIELSLVEVRALLADRLAGRPTRANFRTGHLTVCTLHPMRSVPHRVVCLLGLDDGMFPRRSPRDGDDLLLEAPRLGERDPRSEDRQLLLDALMACTERLIVTYTGHDERTNAARPPAVPVGELLDVVEATARRTEPVLVTHPLQPFDPRNFQPCSAAGRPWSFDAVALAGARALGAGRRPPAPFLTRALPAPEDPLIELSDLVRFFAHPVRAFLRRRLGVSLRLDADAVQDALPVQLDGLDRWAVGQRLLDARLRGIDARRAIRAEIARGTLPPGVLGKPIIDALHPLVEAIVGEARNCVAGGAPQAGDPVDVRVSLPDGRLLSGTVTGVCGDVVLTTTFSRISPRHRLSAWVQLLAVSASCPQRPLAAATIGRGSQADDVRVARIAPLGRDAHERQRIARHHLTSLVDLFDRGLREPLPIACATSAAYGQAAYSGQDGVAAARSEWESGFGVDREDRQPEHQLAFGGVLSLEELLALPALPGGEPEPTDLGEPTRFGRLARRLWDPLLSAERVRAR